MCAACGDATHRVAAPCAGNAVNTESPTTENVDITFRTISDVESVDTARENTEMMLRLQRVLPRETVGKYGVC